MERCFSYDFEWCVRTGTLACMTWCELLPDGSHTEPELLPAWPGADARARELFADVARSPSWVILGQNVAGDNLKAALTWDLLPEVERAYAQGRVRCTMLAQRLIDVAWPGRLVWVPLRSREDAEEAEDSGEDDEVDDEDFEVRSGRQGFWVPRKFRPDRLTGKEVMFTTDDDDGGRGMLAKAGLETLAARYLGLDLSADKKGAESWRRRYGELIGVPVDDWPEEARRYALMDPALTARVRAEQVKRPPAKYGGPWVDVLYKEAPPGCVPWAPLRCERFEVHAHFAFADMERRGLERDQPRVERMRATLQRAAAAGERTAIKGGVVRLRVSHDAEAAARAGLTALEVKHDAAAGKAAGLPAAEVRRIFHAAREAAEARRDDEVRALAEVHPWLRVEEKRDAAAIRAAFDEARALADRRDVDALEAFAAERPWLTVERVKAQGEIVERAEALYREAGWRELPKTDSGNVSAGAEFLRQVVRPSPGADPSAADDLRALLSPDLLAHLQAWTEAGEIDRIERALQSANDPGVAAHVARQKCQTCDSSFLARLDARSRREDPERYPDPDGPARFGVSPFKATGRTGLRGDIGQNWPQTGGFRECIVPRRGRVFLVADFAACEMSTFADVLDVLVCEQLYGQPGRVSTLGEAIRRGDDCHLRLAAVMRREPYQQLFDFYVPIKHKIDAEGKGAIPKGELRDWLDLDLDRKGAKEGNFGGAGGMGPAKFARLQRKKGRDCDEPRARFILESWRECWEPEVPDYFSLAQRATGDRGRQKSATVVHLRGGHVRGGLGYCQWANTWFQQLAAAGAKRAAILLFRACRLDATSPLYGADPVLFVHDEFIVECDADRLQMVQDPAHPDDPTKQVSLTLREMERLMVRGMSAVCRTPVKAEGKILRERWCK